MTLTRIIATTCLVFGAAAAPGRTAAAASLGAVLDSLAGPPSTRFT